MSVRERIFRILKDPQYQRPGTEDTSADDIFALVDENSWAEINQVLMEILQTEAMRSDWDTVTTVFYYALGKNYPVSADRLIALLYHCMIATDETQSGIHDGNLVWTITREFKGVKYDSDYDPFKDPGVWQEIQRLK